MHIIGELGEKLVALWLESKNYQILARRWRCRWGEIDLIALEQSSNTLVFIEVKTRSHNNWDAEGILAIDLRKQQKIEKTAQMFLAQNPQLADFPCRFDVALVSYRSYLYRSPILLSENNYALQLEQKQPTLRNKQHLVMLTEYLESAFE